MNSFLCSSCFHHKRTLHTDEHVMQSFYEMVEFCTQMGKRKSNNGLYMILSLVTCLRTWENRMEPHQGKYRLKIRKRLFTEKLVSHWNKLLTKLVMTTTCQSSRSFWTMLLVTWLNFRWS